MSFYFLNAHPGHIVNNLVACYSQHYTFQNKYERNSARYKTDSKVIYNVKNINILNKCSLYIQIYKNIYKYIQIYKTVMLNFYNI